MTTNRSVLHRAVFLSTYISSENLKEEDDLEDLRIYERIILIKEGKRVRTGFIRFKFGLAVLVNTMMNPSHKCLEIF
jgi:hypothetical protein